MKRFFSRFLDNFSEDQQCENGQIADEILERVDSDFTKTIELLGGRSFSEGLYRVIPGHNIAASLANLLVAFPEYEGRIVPFAYDWLGRYFAIDEKRHQDGKPMVLLLEVGVGEAMQIPVPIVEFHNEEIVDYRADALASNFFDEWKSTNAQPIQPDACVGYKVPLFLGGSDTVDNLEIISLDIYVTLCGQLRHHAATLRDGQSLGDIEIR